MRKFGEGVQAVTAATKILAFGWTFSWLWFGLSALFLVILAWCATLGERWASLGWLLVCYRNYSVCQS
jgi:hypothetical protein